MTALGKVKVDVIGQLPLKQQLGLLHMPPRRRKRLLNKVVKKCIRDSKGRVRKQVDLQGRPFAARKRKSRRKMLSKLVRQLKVTELNGQYGVAGFYSRKTGRIAADQQYGKVTVVTAKSQPAMSSDNNKPATRKQARALLDLDYKMKRPSGRGMKRPSIKHIVGTLSQGQAGAIIHAMRIKEGIPINSRWETVLPARAFLGATPREVSQHITTIYSDMKQEMAYVRR